MRRRIDFDGRWCCAAPARRQMLEDEAKRMRRDNATTFRLQRAAKERWVRRRAARKAA